MGRGLVLEGVKKTKLPILLTDEDCVLDYLSFVVWLRIIDPIRGIYIEFFCPKIPL